MATTSEILDALRSVVDPELGVNVVDLGLIYGIDMDEDSIHIRMTLTTSGCPLHETMLEAVRYVAQMAALTKSIHVDLVWTPGWSPERMSDEARAQLGWSLSEE